MSNQGPRNGDNIQENWARLITLFDRFSQDQRSSIRTDIIHTIAFLIAKNFRPPTAYASRRPPQSRPNYSIHYLRALRIYIKSYNLVQINLEATGGRYDTLITIDGRLP